MCGEVRGEREKERERRDVAGQGRQGDATASRQQQSGEAAANSFCFCRVEATKGNRRQSARRVESENEAGLYEPKRWSSSQSCLSLMPFKSPSP